MDLRGGGDRDLDSGRCLDLDNRECFDLRRGRDLGLGAVGDPDFDVGRGPGLDVLSVVASGTPLSARALTLARGEVHGARAPIPQLTSV